MTGRLLLMLRIVTGTYTRAPLSLLRWSSKKLTNRWLGSFSSHVVRTDVVRFSRSRAFSASTHSLFLGPQFKARRTRAPITGHDAHASLMHGTRNGLRMAKQEGHEPLAERRCFAMPTRPWPGGTGHAGDQADRTHGDALHDHIVENCAQRPPTMVCGSMLRVSMQVRRQITKKIAQLDAPLQRHAACCQTSISLGAGKRRTNGVGSPLRRAARVAGRPESGIQTDR